MKDGFGRNIEYLRVSVTPNCNLKCIYCNPNPDSPFDAPSLTAKEFAEIIRSMAQVGIRKIRITGGEPLTRSDICEIIERITEIPQINDISMTTNGIKLDTMAEQLKAAGLRRLNISLDSLKADRFSYITGGGMLSKTLKGIEKALQLGFNPVKINTVVIKGVNDDEIDDLIRLAKDQPLEVRLIELMPIGEFGQENSSKTIYNSDIIQARPELIACPNNSGGQPAEYYQIKGFLGKIGFISPLSHQFCSRCNRIRLTSDGKLKLCLGQNMEVDLIKVLRENPVQLDYLIKWSIRQKPQGHQFENGFCSNRNMNMIGG